MMRISIAWVAFAAAYVCPAALANQPPATPTITEPASAGLILNPQDVHMETAPFQDADPGDQHGCSDWEIWTVAPAQRVWFASCVTGPEKIHAHLGDGTFEGSHAGMTQLMPQTQFRLRVRHKDDSADATSEWSAFAERTFSTGSSAIHFPLLLDDVADVPDPIWIQAATGAAAVLPAGASLSVVTGTGQLLLQVNGSAGGNTIVNPAALAGHAAVKVALSTGSASLTLPATDLAIVEHACEAHTVLLPAVSLGPFQQSWFWVSAEGATYAGTASQVNPSFVNPARLLDPPFAARQVGYSVDVVAEGLKLPVNIAFVPNPGSSPTSPFFYVTELHGAIKTVRNDLTVNTYASGLLDYTPPTSFPGAGEQGVAGIAVDPTNGDLYVGMLRKSGPFTSSVVPKVVRFTSNDGGLTAASQTTILDMPGETQGQSHFISRIELLGVELYVHMGDGFNSSTAQNLSSFRGKILRMNKDGSPVSSNPFYNAADGITARDYVWAYGVRNPFGGAWRAKDGHRYLAENGPSVDRFTRLESGKNYLWSGSDADMFNFALYNWVPASGPVNLAFIQPETFGGSGFPPAKTDHAFVSESGPTYAQGAQQYGKRISEFTLDLAGNLTSGPSPLVEYVGEGRGTVVGLAAGPDGLYFTELYKDINTSGPTATGGRVLRVRYGAAGDCDHDGDPDFCEIATGLAVDCDGNGVPDGCELAAGAATDFDGNGLNDRCDPLSEDVDQVSLSSGGTVSFTLDGGTSLGGQGYILLGSATGTAPGTPIGAILLPLNVVNDPYFAITAAFANSPILPGSLGSLDPNGRGSAALVVPPASAPSAAGVVLHHAWVAFSAQGAPLFASNAVPVTLAP